MKQIPLVKPHLPQLSEISAELSQVHESGRLTNFGPFSKRFEVEIAELLNVKYVLAVSNATTGLMMVLNSLPKNSEVIVPSFTFLPTVQAILWNSLTPVFADIDETYTLCLKSVESSISNKTSAILGVHSFGNPCDIDGLKTLGEKYELKIYFDAAHAIGSMYKGSYIGSFGEAEVFSLSATKLLPCGEGGIITTNSDEVFERMLNMRNYGFKFGTYDSIGLGLNAKFSEYNAILGLWGIAKENGVRRIDTKVKRRNELANIYLQKLSKLQSFEFQCIQQDAISAYKDFTIKMKKRPNKIDRDILKKELSNKGIETSTYFWPPIHRMHLFKSVDHQFDLKFTEVISDQILSLPIYYLLAEEEQDYVIKSLEEILK